MSSIELGKNKRFPDVSADVIESAIGGDEEAQTQIYQHYGNRVRGYFFNSYIPVDDVEDLSQDVWERVFRGLPTFEIQPDHPFQNWLFRTVKNVKIDFYRKFLSHKEVVGEQITVSSGHPYSGPEEAIEMLELFDVIRGQIKGIEPHQAAAFYHHYVQGFTHRESAGMMGTSEGNARQLSSRGLGQLRLGLKREGL